MNMLGLEPLVPAYGRDYKNIEKLQEDFNKNMDFSTPMGQYINKAQLLQLCANGEITNKINIRYAQLRKVTRVKIC